MTPAHHGDEHVVCGLWQLGRLHLYDKDANPAFAAAALVFGIEAD